ncbi:MAG: ACP S-malonyltransferase [Candidatus Anammoxibacter sp.]
MANLTKKTYLFPGQGAQYVGMGKDVYDNSRMARRLYDNANDILGFDLANICFSGNKEELDRTSICQPAVLVTSLAIMEALKEQGNHDVDCFAVAGLSLGEYTALVFSGAIKFEDAIKLVHKRGEYMEDACEEFPGGMLTIMGLDDEIIEEICRDVQWAGAISPANYNYPGQVVVSGENEALKEAAKVATERGANMVIPLNVSGAFHSSLMASASKKLEEALNNVPISKARIPVATNVDGRYISEPDEIKETLIKQLTSPVLWSHSVQNLIRDGVEEFYGIGPGRVIVGILKRINRKKSINSIDKFESFRYN